MTRRIDSLELMASLEAHAVSAGVRNPAYVIARLLRQRGLREYVETTWQDGPKKTISTHVFTSEERELLDRCLARAYRPEVYRSIRTQRRVSQMMRNEAYPDEEPVTWGGFEHEYAKEAQARAKARRKESRSFREELERTPGLAEKDIEVTMRDCCDGSGWATEYIESDDLGDGKVLTRRVRCEQCQAREREQHLQREECKRVVLACLVSMILVYGTNMGDLLKCRKDRRLQLNAFMAVCALHMPREVILEVTRWSPSTLSKAIKEAEKHWPEVLGRKSSATPPSPSTRGRPNTGVEDSSPSAPNLSKEQPVTKEQKKRLREIAVELVDMTLEDEEPDQVARLPLGSDLEDVA
jgi:hypothetical protein